MGKQPQTDKHIQIVAALPLWGESLLLPTVWSLYSADQIALHLETKYRHYLKKYKQGSLRSF
jgi:hypothetical protein